MEVALDDGSVSFDINDVLRKWRNDFCSLFNGTTRVTDTDIDSDNSNDNASSNMTNDASSQHFQQNYNEHISIYEVKKAIVVKLPV